MNIDKIIDQSLHWLITTGPKIALVLVGAITFIVVLRKLNHNYFNRYLGRYSDNFNKRAETLRSVIMHLITISVVVITTMIILTQLDVNVGPILAATGIVGVAVGFGAQHLVKDVISGFFMLMEDEIRVGDVVEIAGKSGLVERMNLRMTVLRDLAGNVHFVPNGEISVVTNMTKDYSRYVFEIGVAYRENVDQVIEVIKQVDEDLRQDEGFKTDILEPVEILGLDRFADSAVIIKARTKTRPIRQWAVGREFNRRLKQRFDEMDIEIPYPHLTLYAGQDREGTAAPLRIKTD